MTNKNFHKVDGIVHSKPVKEGTSKKGEHYSIPSIVLEIDDSYTDKSGKYHSNSSLAEFKVSKNVQSLLDTFSVRDSVTISFKLGGKEYNGRLYNENLCFGINHADLDADRDPRIGNIKTDPKPQEAVVEDDEDDQLPF